MNRALAFTIDHNDPEALAAFYAAWTLPECRRQAIQARAGADRRFADEVRTLGKIAAVTAQVQRTMRGASA